MGQRLLGGGFGPYADNTIVVFWSDNGYHCGEKNHWEQATLTPMAMRVPGMKTGGQISPCPVNSLDIYPTLVELCGLQGPEHTLDGLSLRPFLDEVHAGRARPAITTYGEGNYSARDERYRYIRYHDGTEELYDHDNDPNEFVNLADDPSLADVKKRLSRWIPEIWAKCLGGRLA